MTLPFLERIGTISCYFLNFFLPKPARPTKPRPNRSIVEGSGTVVFIIVLVIVIVPPSAVGSGFDGDPAPIVNGGSVD